MKTVKTTLCITASILLFAILGCEKPMSSILISNYSPDTYMIMLNGLDQGEIDTNESFSLALEPGIYQLTAVQITGIEDRPDTKGGELHVLPGESMTWSFY